MATFKMLHYSDTHNRANPIAAAHAVRSTLNPDSFINTGDIVNDKFEDSITNNEPNDYQLVLGNHDCILESGLDPNGYHWDEQPTQSQKISKYFTPLLNNNVPMEFDTENATWWSYPYSDFKIMIVAIDCTVRGSLVTEQNQWLTDILEYCKQNDFSVIFASHMPPSNVPVISCSWTDPFYYSSGYPDTTGFEAFYPAVRSTYTILCNAADNGLNVLAFINGHEHADGLFNAGNVVKFPMISIGSTIIDSYNDLYRVDNVSNSSCPVTNLYEFNDISKSLVCWRYGAEYAHSGARRFMFAYDYVTREYTSKL